MPSDPSRAKLSTALKKAAEKTLSSPSTTRRKVLKLPWKSEHDRRAAKLSRNNKRYDPEAFEDWWFPLPDSLRKGIDEAAKGFVSYSQLLNAYMNSTMPGAGSYYLTTEDRWSELVRSLPAITKEDFARLEDATAKERSKYAAEIARRTSETIREHLGVPPHREKSNFHRDYLLTKWVDEDEMTKEEARDKWAKDHPGDKPLTPAAVSQAIKRMRDEKVVESDRWARRLFVYGTNFPRMPELTCSKCKGIGTLPNPAWDTWREWHKSADKLQLGRLTFTGSPKGPEPKAPGRACLKCKACGGSGRVPPT